MNIPGYSYATINDTDRINPNNHQNIYHGTAKISPTDCNTHNGLPAGGTDIDLVRHAEPPPARKEPSAFIGTVPFPKAPGFEAGAAYWAGEDGWVYHINDWPGYDINQVLEGRIPDGKGGYRGPFHIGEQEVAVPARVPKNKIVKIGKVVMQRGGLAVTWGLK